MLAAIPFFELKVYNLDLGFVTLPIDPWATLVAIGIVVGLEVARWKGIRSGLDTRDVVDGAIAIVLSGFVGAHLVTLFFYFPERLARTGSPPCSRRRASPAREASSERWLAHGASTTTSGPTSAPFSMPMSSALAFRSAGSSVDWGAPPSRPYRRQDELLPWDGLRRRVRLVSGAPPTSQTESATSSGCTKRSS